MRVPPSRIYYDMKKYDGWRNHAYLLPKTLRRPELVALRVLLAHATVSLVSAYLQQTLLVRQLVVAYLRLRLVLLFRDFTVSLVRKVYQARLRRGKRQRVPTLPLSALRVPRHLELVRGHLLLALLLAVLKLRVRLVFAKITVWLVKRLRVQEVRPCVDALAAQLQLRPQRHLMRPTWPLMQDGLQLMTVVLQFAHTMLYLAVSAELFGELLVGTQVQHFQQKEPLVSLVEHRVLLPLLLWSLPLIVQKSIRGLVDHVRRQGRPATNGLKSPLARMEEQL